MKNQYIYQNKDIVNAAKVVSEQLNIDLSSVMEAYKLFFESIVNDIESKDFSDFDNIKDSHMSYNVPSLFKLYTDEKIINVINNKKYKNSESITDKQSDTITD